MAIKIGMREAYCETTCGLSDAYFITVRLAYWESYLQLRERSGNIICEKDKWEEQGD
jgi:hypothetical protein